MTHPEFKTAMQDLLRTIKYDENAFIVEETVPERIIVMDMLKERRIVYRMLPHTAESFESIIFAGRNVRLTDDQKSAIARRLLVLPPEITLNLRGIILVRNADDIRDFTTQCGVNDEWIPDILVDEDEKNGLNNDLVGVSWYYESSVILNVTALEQAAKAVTSDRPGLYDKELDVGFWTTLLHEIRQIQLDCMPYDVPWIDKTENTPEKVEAWAIETYETIF